MVREHLAYTKRVFDLGKDYIDCDPRQSGCDLTKRWADPTYGCQNCEYTKQYKTFVHETEQKLLTVNVPRDQRDYDFDFLMEMVMNIANIVGDSEKDDPNWNRFICLIGSIYRGELSRFKRLHKQTTE